MGFPHFISECLGLSSALLPIPVVAHMVRGMGNGSGGWVSDAQVGPLASAWPSPGCRTHLGSKPEDG